MNLFLKFLVALLILFTPFSFAATEPWAFSTVQGLSFLLLILLIIARKEWVYPSLLKPVVYVFCVLILLALIQSCFPQTLLDKPAWHPMTLMRLYTLEHASVFITYLAVVLCIGQVFPSSKDSKQLMMGLVLTAVLVALCAWAMPQGQYVAKLTGITKYTGAIGPFVNRNHAGVFFAMNALLALGLFFTHQLRQKQLLSREQKMAFRWQQISWGLITLGLMTSTIFTRSRGAILSLVLGIFAYAFLCIWCVPQVMRKRLKGFFYTFLLLGLTAGWTYLHVEDINEFAYRTNGASTQTRQMLYYAAYDLLHQYPLWGIGIGALPVAIEDYTQWNTGQYIERLHNDWLEITLGVGIFGAVLIGVGLVWFFIKALKRLKRLKLEQQFEFASLLSSMFAMCIGSMVDFHFFIPGCALVFFICLGILLSPTFHKHHLHVLRGSIVSSGLVILICIAATWIPIQKARCWRQFLWGKGLKTQTKLAAYEKGLSLYDSPHYAVRLAKGYYKAARQEKDPIVKQYYFEQAYRIAQTYLEQYPKDKELSVVYVRAKAHLY